jgi:hypothetical protein
LVTLGGGSSSSKGRRRFFRTLDLSSVSVMNCRIQRDAVRGDGLVKIAQSLG